MLVHRIRSYVVLGFLTLSALGHRGSAAWGEDWPQWNGPDRTGVYRESGVLDTIPEGGLKLLWQAPVAGGYSGPAVANGRVFLSDFVKDGGEVVNDPANRAQLVGKERMLCFEAGSGKPLWTYEHAASYSISYPVGPRVTPLVDGDRVYLLGAEGDLVCLNVESGKPVWKHQLPKDYGTETPLWGYSSSPLVLGDQLICMAGGKGSVVISLDKKTGQERWRSLDAKEIGYAPPTLIEAGGTQQLLIWDAERLHGINPKDGKEYWSVPLAPSYGMSIMAPVRSGNRLFASGIGGVGMMMELEGDKPGIKTLWKGNPKNALYSGNCTPYFDGDYVYGCDCGKGTFVCFRASDGERMWETFEPTGGGTNRISHGTCFVTPFQDRYFLFSETGDFIIAKLTPEKYDELGRCHVIDPTNECFGRKVAWSYPAYAQKCLFVRSDVELRCYSLAK